MFARGTVQLSRVVAIFAMLLSVCVGCVGGPQPTPPNNPGNGFHGGRQDPNETDNTPTANAGDAGRSGSGTVADAAVARYDAAPPPAKSDAGTTLDACIDSDSDTDADAYTKQSPVPSVDVTSGAR